VIPLAAFPALPNQSYIIQPNSTFYVSTGTYQAGAIVNATSFGTIATINFSEAKPGQTIATITHNDHSEYEGPVFSYPTEDSEPA
jgi:hypothetical protein